MGTSQTSIEHNLASAGILITRRGGHASVSIGGVVGCTNTFRQASRPVARLPVGPSHGNMISHIPSAKHYKAKNQKQMKLKLFVPSGKSSATQGLGFRTSSFSPQSLTGLGFLIYSEPQKVGTWTSLISDGTGIP